MDLTRGVLVTGAEGQFGAALCEEFRGSDLVALTPTDWDITLPPPPLPAVDLVLHAAAWTDVDGAETHPQEAAAANVAGTQHAAENRRAARPVLDRLCVRRQEAVAVP